MNNVLPTILSALFACAVVLIGSTGVCVAQEDEAQEDEYVYVEEQAPYYGLGAGYMRSLTFINHDPLNGVNASLGLNNFEGPFNTDMGGLLFTPGMLRNIRFGIYIGSGIDQSTQTVVLRDGQSYTRTVYFTNVLVGALVDYAMPISRPLTFFAGAMIGGGRYTIGASQTRIGGEEFANIFDPGLFNGDSQRNTENLNRFARLRAYHLVLQPTINLEYSISANLMLRIGAGYDTGIIVGGWDDEGGSVILNTPDFTTRGVTAHIGLFLGLFQH